MRICSVCGERNEDWMDICQRCGRSIENAEVDNSYDTSTKFDYDEYKIEEEKEEKKESKPKLFLANMDLKIILAILLLILFVLLMILFTMK